jgi:hypothetical protein
MFGKENCKLPITIWSNSTVSSKIMPSLFPDSYISLHMSGIIGKNSPLSFAFLTVNALQVKEGKPKAQV